jgi:glycosyltransferase involved in cell wall biosynthesis
MQRHRRFDILLEGIRKARPRVPGLRLSVIGRGTRMQEVAVEPARRLGLSDIVTFTGYLRDDYLATLAGFDAFIFLVPGSDGTCRALREAMALGLPCIGARRGLIPELLENRGLVIDDSPEGIASAVERLAKDPELGFSLGKKARKHAFAAFDAAAQARRIFAIYGELCSA